MDTKKLLGTNNIALPPLRELDDFVLGSARFQLPNFQDFEKWGNRVVNNLLYYQSNYMLLYIIMFLIVGMIHPLKMIMGWMTVLVIYIAFVYVSSQGRIYDFKKQYPITVILAVTCTGVFVTYTLGSLLVFLLGILLPFSVTFVHASLRLRNMKNKMSNKIEGIGLMRTPMGALLEYCGMEGEFLS